MNPVSALPIPAKRALRKLGQDIRDARKRRLIPMELMADRARISRSTLHKVERGDESVALGFYASVLFVLGLIDSLANLADIGADAVGRSLEERHLPTRIRLRKPRSASVGKTVDGRDPGNAADPASVSRHRERRR
jgi:transcriptional regulator with XRE-family HTH domain